MTRRRRSSSLYRKQHPSVGAQPGTLALPPDAVAPVIRYMSFDESRFDEGQIEDVSKLMPQSKDELVTWIDVQGLGSERILLDIARVFDIHPLAIEDVVHVPQRPKSEAYKKHHLLITRMLRAMDDGGVDVEQVSVVVGEDYVITFQERHGDVLEPVRDRLRHGRGRIRRSGTGYLAYAILDTIVDAYYPVLEHLSDRMVALEDEIFNDPSPAIIQELSATRATLLAVRRTTWPLRDAVNSLIREESPFFGEEVRLFLRDVHDHTVHAAETVENFRELTAGLLNTYLSVMSNRMNEVMKVLTIMATIFIPLTFMSGVYGMNFEHMPELRWKWGYPAVLGLMGCTAVGLIGYFWRKGWLRREP